MITPISSDPAQESGAAVRRSERTIARVLAAIVAGNGGGVLLPVIDGWDRARIPFLLVIGPVLAAVYVLVFWRADTPPAQRRPGAIWAEFALGASMCAAGAAAEAFGEPLGVADRMSNNGFGLLAAFAFASARLPRWWSLSVVSLAAISHVLVLHDSLTSGVQGGVQLLVLWVCARLVARELRRAGTDADQVSRAARLAGREEASAHVHDGLGQLRVVSRLGASGTAVTPTGPGAYRRRAWPEWGTAAQPLAEVIARCVDSYPDLPVRADLRALSAPVEPSVAAATARAVHTLLGNVREHAFADQVIVHGTDAGTGWALSIADDGVGFDVSRLVPGAGLSRFTQQALTPLGVTCQVRSAPGRGTRVRLEGPAQPARSAQTPDAGADGRWRLGRLAQLGRLGRRGRPEFGLERALWVIWVSRALMVASLWAITVGGIGDLWRTHSHPLICLLALLVGCLAATASWLDDSRRFIGFTVLTAVAGWVVTVLAGQDASSGGKLGLLLVVWAYMLLIAARPAQICTAIALGAVEGVLVARADLMEGLIVTAWAVLAILITAQIVTSWTRLGADADADRRRAADSERQVAEGLLDRQIEAMILSPYSATDAQVNRQVGDVVRESEAYLRPGETAGGFQQDLQAGLDRLAADRPGRLQVRMSDLRAESPPDPAVVPAVVELIQRLLDDPAGDRADTTADTTAGAGVRVRASSLGEAWQIMITVDLVAAPALPPGPTGHLHRAGVELRTRSLPGSTRVELTWSPVVMAGNPHVHGPGSAAESRPADPVRFSRFSRFGRGS